MSKVLRVMAGSPTDLQPICDTILEAATNLCRADGGMLRLIDKEGLRLVAQRVSLSVAKYYSPPTIAEDSSYIVRAATSRTLVHVPNVAALELYRQGDPTLVAAVKAGVGTILIVPMLRDDHVIGSLALYRERVEPFTDKETELVRDFAAEAAIALEIVHRERQLREVQTELAHVNRVATIGQLAASIAHELKQPLAAVLLTGSTTLRWLARRPPNIKKAKQLIEAIIRDANRANDVLARIHGFVKKELPRTDTIDLNDAIREVIILIHAEAAKNGVTVQTSLADHLPRIRGDRIELQQVVLNLMVNAIQAMSGVVEGKRELEITTARIEGGVRVEVRDTGLGLTAESLERIFEPFYTTKAGGMGIGLSICRSIIEAHAGRLWATVCEPRGALFQFTIPAI